MHSLDRGDRGDRGDTRRNRPPSLQNKCRPMRGDTGATHSAPKTVALLSPHDGATPKLQQTLQNGCTVAPVAPVAPLRPKSVEGFMHAVANITGRSSAQTAHIERYVTWCERAAIIEFEAEKTRRDAERAATMEMKK